MGLFSKQPKVDWTKSITRNEEAARTEAARVKAARQRLAKGSDDPEADRYLIKEAEAGLRIARANLRDIRRMQG